MCTQPCILPSFQRMSMVLGRLQARRVCAVCCDCSCLHARMFAQQFARLVSCRSYSLPVKDRAGRKWEFVIKSWANGTENRRVYVLEQTGEYLKVSLLPAWHLCTLHCMYACCSVNDHYQTAFALFIGSWVHASPDRLVWKASNCPY